MKTKIFLLILGCVKILNSSAQDAHFSQWHSSKLTLNPSLAGANGCMNADVTYRDQWPKLSGNYKTTLVSWDKYFKKLHGGLGSYFMHDKSGPISSSRAAITYAPQFKLLNQKVLIIPSLEFALKKTKIDLSSLTFGDQIDPARGFVFNTLDPMKTESTIFDISTGILIVTNQFYAGFSAYHITRPNESLTNSVSELPIRYSFHAGYTFGGKDSVSNFFVTPGIIYVTQQSSNIILPSVKARYKFLTISFAYRKDDGFIVGSTLRIKWVELGYSYDKTISNLNDNFRGGTGGTHEIHLGIFFKNKNTNGLFLKNPGL